MMQRSGVQSSVGSLCLVVVVLLLSGCSVFEWVGFGNKSSYENAGTIGDLEAPPELVNPNWDESLELPQTANERVSAVDTYGKAIDAAVAPEFVEFELRREGSLRWLEAEVDPVSLWPLLRSFWADQAVEIARDEPGLGIMETEWIEQIDSEQLAGTNDRLVTAMRTKYRVRLEREPNSVTNIFLTQRRSELNDITDQGGVWSSTDSDPEQEAEVMIELMVHLGQARDDAEARYARAQGSRLYMELKDVGGIPVLLIGDIYSRVWRRSGVALDRAGFTVFDQDRASGVILFDVATFDSPEQVPLSHDRYEIHLLSQGSQTLLTAHNVGQASEVISNEEAKLLLKQILSSYQVL